MSVIPHIIFTRCLLYHAYHSYLRYQPSTKKVLEINEDDFSDFEGTFKLCKSVKFTDEGSIHDDEWEEAVKQRH